MIEKIGTFIRNNFDCFKIIIKGHTSSRRSLSYLKELSKQRSFGSQNKKTKGLISFKHYVPVVHNGCRPPKKRRI